VAVDIRIVPDRQTGCGPLPLVCRRVKLVGMVMPVAKIVSYVTPKRRRAQFSLATMFVVVTAFCVWLAWQVNRAKRQREGVAALRTLGAAVFQVDPAASKRLARDLPKTHKWLGAAYVEPLEYVSLRHANALDARPEKIETALKLLKDLSGLRRLNLEGLPLTERNMKQLASLPTLSELDLGYTGVGEPALDRLQESLPKCRIIR
jgi:hypothetical protein